MIPQNHQRIPVERRRTPFAKPVAGLHVAKIFFPLQDSLQVVTVQPAGTEISEQELSVGPRRSGGKPMVMMMAFVGHFFPRHLLPQRFARRSIKAKDNKLVKFVRWWFRSKTTPEPRRPPRLAFASGAVFPFSGWAAAFLPLGIAVNRNTRSCQMMGVEVPNPGVATFHLMFLVSLHSSGGLATGETPVNRGPRHWGQLASCSAAILERQLKARNTPKKRATPLAVIRKLL